MDVDEATESVKFLGGEGAEKIGTPHEIHIFSIIIHLQIHTTYAMLSSGIY